MSTIFSKIAAGEIPSYKCAEDDKFYAFLDINPVKKAHTLICHARRLTTSSTWTTTTSPLSRCSPRRWQ